MAPTIGGGNYGDGLRDSSKLLSHSLRADGFDASEAGTGRGTPLTIIQDARDEVRLMGGDGHYAAGGPSVRRLTPVECERLQGFPDGWTDVDGAKDGPRYKALGNAVTVPVIEYIGRQIMAELGR